MRRARIVAILSSQLCIHESDPKTVETFFLDASNSASIASSLAMAACSCWLGSIDKLKI